MPRRRATSGRVLLWAAGLGLLLLLCLIAAGSLGAGRVGLTDLFRWGSLDDSERTILLHVRLPRVLLAAVLGGALTVAGVVFQALLRNPLADPYILGVSGGASVGGVLALVLGVGALGPLGVVGVPGMAFLGALGALLLIERVATVGGRFTVHTILLTGVVFNAFCASLIYFIQSVASLEELHAIVFYLMGNIRGDLSYGGVGALALVTLAATAALYTMARDYNALSLGEEGAAQLGVDVERLKHRTFVIGSLLTGLAVSVAGLIGFVGLVVPHLLRLVLGPDHRLMLPAGLLGGASFLVAADMTARLAVAPGELPVGVVTALVGGPFFLFLLRRRGGGYGFL
ncbi:MAG: iron ABC transporter permease [bacterium]